MPGGDLPTCTCIGAFPPVQILQWIYCALQQINSNTMPATGGGENVNILTFRGAANQATGQVVTSTTAATFVAARATRRSVTLRNLDTSIAVWVGPATVTAANGMQLKAGESITVDTTALIQVIAASGTPTVAYYETYD